MRYSQNNETEIISAYFALWDNIPTFLDVGANDGITLSNTYALTLCGSDGTLIEASPVAFKRLQKNYTGKPHTLISAALTDFNGEITLYESGEHLGKGDSSLLSTVVPGEMSRWKKEKFTPVKVPAINFDTMLGLSKIKTFDFISLDVEGVEVDILPQMDLRALGCSLLCVEYNGKDQQWYDNLILPQGFKLLHKNGENLIYGI